MVRPSTGLRVLDDLIGGVRVGDNLVFETSGEIAIDGFVSAFVRASKRASGLAYVSFHVPPTVVLDRYAADLDLSRAVLVDCYTDGAGGSEPAFERFYRSNEARGARVTRVREAAAVDAVQRSMTSLEDDRGPGTRYVFDSLTGMQELWGAEAALSFFLRSCPRLYELRTVALWLLDREAHDRSFLSRLTRVTQVVVRIEADDEGFALRVVKAEGRAAEVTGRRARIRFGSGRATLVEEREAATKERVGALLRERRKLRGMSQAELARKIGVSPSAVSQAERGTAGLSGSTLTRAWDALGVPFGAIDGSVVPPYRLSRRGARTTRAIAAGLEAEEIAADGGAGTHLLRFARGASGRRPPFATKRRELVVVISGVLEIRIGESTEALQAGDAIEISTEPAAAWRNLAPQETVALWSILP
jgi:transcriptional regulator with XRE-family HTH domain